MKSCKSSEGFKTNLDDTNFGLLTSLVYGYFGDTLNPILDRICDVWHNLGDPVGESAKGPDLKSLNLNCFPKILSFTLREVFILRRKLQNLNDQPPSR
jgi:hypothetical protein